MYCPRLGFLIAILVVELEDGLTATKTDVDPSGCLDLSTASLAHRPSLLHPLNLRISIGPEGL